MPKYCFTMLNTETVQSNYYNACVNTSNDLKKQTMTL